MSQKSSGHLEALLRRGAFVMTAETTPPDAASPTAVLERAGCLKGLADAVNVTDGAGARAHMSAFACAVVLAQHGIEPVLQLTIRDRNRLALQGDLIGASALGIPNILCLHGDDPQTGDQPEAKPVHDLNTRGLISTARRLREEGVLPSGRAVTPAPRLFIGAADGLPDEGEWLTDGLEAKLEAGADFIQTQYCFDLHRLRGYLDRLRDRGLLERHYLIVGIGPLASAHSARWMNERLLGVHIPQAIIARLERASDQGAEGQRICIEMLQQLAEIDGVAGAHLMGPRSEQAIAETIDECGLLKNRKAA
jgi:methylenetetrahydrofolate reductase (NADPH)